MRASPCSRQTGGSPLLSQCCSCHEHPSLDAHQSRTVLQVDTLDMEALRSIFSRHDLWEPKLVPVKG
jgi:hypothetical protein